MSFCLFLPSRCATSIDSLFVTFWVSMTWTIIYIYTTFRWIICQQILGTTYHYSKAHHPIWWKIRCWPWSRPTSEKLDHTAKLGFYPPDFLNACQLYSSPNCISPWHTIPHKCFLLSLLLNFSNICCSDLHIYLPSSHLVLVFCSPMETSSLLFLLKSDVFQL